MTDDRDRIWLRDMSEAYERWLEPAFFRPFATDLTRRAAALEPARVLELAAGTGALTRQLTAALPNATVTATDLNPAMVEVGAPLAPGATWRQADALALPFGDGEFDLVVCQFGVMFFPDKVAGFREAARVLAPGGRLLFNSWDTVETHGFAAAFVAGIERAFPADPPTFVAAVPHGYADPARIEADVAAAGLRVASVERVVLDGRAESTAELARGMCTGTPIRAAIEQRADLEDVVATVADEMRARLGDGPAVASLAAYVVEAVATA